MKSSLTLPTVLLGGALSLGGCAMSSGPYVVSAEADRRCSTTERLVDGVLTVTGDTCRETRERRTVGWVGGYQERATIVETCTVYRERIDGALRETRRECTEKERVRTDDGYRGGYTYSTRRWRSGYQARCTLSLKKGFRCSSADGEDTDFVLPEPVYDVTVRPRPDEV